jgi:hypothetical protein
MLDDGEKWWGVALGDATRRVCGKNVGPRKVDWLLVEN